MESEKYRARNRYYNELLNVADDINLQGSLIGNELLYAGRRIHRSEVAKRISVADARYLEKVYTKWLWDCELAMAFYGACFLQIRGYGTWRGYTNDSNQI
jgi:hypothetical protein